MEAGFGRRTHFRFGLGGLFQQGHGAAFLVPGAGGVVGARGAAVVPVAAGAGVVPDFGGGRAFLVLDAGQKSRFVGCELSFQAGEIGFRAGFSRGQALVWCEASSREACFGACLEVGHFARSVFHRVRVTFLFHGDTVGEGLRAVFR